MDSATRRELRDYAWKYFEVHADHRLRAFNFFIIWSTLVIGAFGTLTANMGLKKWLAIFPLILVFLTFIFWKLEERTRMLIKNGESALKYLDSLVQSEISDTNCPHILELFANDDTATASLPKHPFIWGHFSYSRCFRWVFIFFGVVGAISALCCMSCGTN